MKYSEPYVTNAVLRTIGRYTESVDGGRLRDLAHCFVSEGKLQVGDEEPFIGRKAIVQGLIDMVTSSPLPGPPPEYVHHHLAQTRFLTIEQEAVSSVTYFTVMTQIGVDHWGVYQDVMEPSGEEWLISSRTIRVAGFSPTSVMRPTTADSAR